MILQVHNLRADISKPDDMELFILQLYGNMLFHDEVIAWLDDHRDELGYYCDDCITAAVDFFKAKLN